MSKLKVLNWKGESSSQVDSAKDFFVKDINKPLLHEVVCWQLARKRQGHNKAKTRAEVRGGGKKPFRQKGTGQARQGSSNSPLLEGGGVTHGPRPRSYDWALPKKTRKRALQNALSYLHKEGRLFLVENMTSSTGKTKDLGKSLKTLGWNKALLVDEKRDESFKRACKNLKSFKFIAAEGLNVYDLLKFDRVVLTPPALKIVCQKCGAL